jgi:ABC-type transport system involved in cytochrome bd biosynthesis fused ATPase/permease subunit
MMIIAYFLGAMAFVGGIGLTVSSGWLITMASSHPPILTLGVAIVLVRFFGISRSVSRYGERLVSHKAVFDRLTNLRVQMYSKLVGKSIAISSIINSGSTVKALVDDVERAQEYQLRIKLPGSSACISLFAGVLLGWWVQTRIIINNHSCNPFITFHLSGINIKIQYFTCAQLGSAGKQIWPNS